MEITNSFVVAAPIEEAWVLLTNIAEIAPCLPGAKLTDETNGVYSGGIKIKVGPITSEYKGSAEFVEKDDVNFKAVISGKGRDTRGAGNAQALITAQMTPVGTQTTVDIVTDLKVSGKVAQFGRGVMQDVATKLLSQFAECLEAKIAEPETIDEIAAARPGAATKAVAAKAPAHAAPASFVHDDEVDALDLGDIGLGGVLMKNYGKQAGAAAVLVALVWWLARRRKA